MAWCKQDLILVLIVELQRYIPFKLQEKTRTKFVYKNLSNFFRIADLKV